jgi:3D (Asp-Asp-Asp) domain-containing protein
MKKTILFFCVFLLLLFSTAICSAAPGDTPISRGMRGSDVQYAQKLLADAGYYVGEIDGIFGGGTQQAVLAFQRSVNLPATGVINHDTILFLQRSNVEISRSSRSTIMSASAYSAYDPGNGSYTAQGHFLRHGLVAVDPEVIPLGTRLYIPGYGFAIADDVGGSIKGNRIDLAFDSHGEAMQFGRQTVTVYIYD